MKMNKLFKRMVLAGASFSFCFMLIGCSSNTYGLTREEFKLVDKYYKADEMIDDLKRLGYGDAEIERQLRGALAKVKSETGQ